jgi:hypothetical protein
VVIHVDGNLSPSLGLVWHSKRVPHFDLVVSLPANTQESSKDPVLVCTSSKVVVENGGERQRRDDDG